jgi:hypothetical protein
MAVQAVHKATEVALLMGWLRHSSGLARPAWARPASEMVEALVAQRQMVPTEGESGGGRAEAQAG